MENKEMRTNTKKQENDSLGLKIVMAILAVAVVVLTLINAAPISAKGDSKAAEVSENAAVITRNVHISNNADQQVDIVEF